MIEVINALLYYYYVKVNTQVALWGWIKQTNASAGSNSKENSPTLRQRGTYEGQRSGSLSKPICQLSISQIVLYLLSPFHVYHHYIEQQPVYSGTELQLCKHKRQKSFQVFV